MTDNEIIKALEHCRDNGCAGCPLEFMEDDRGCMTEWLALINRQKAEIERLEGWENLLKAEKHSLIKAEAIKEFAERLKGTSACNKITGYGEVVYVRDIDNLVKEMVGADNDR